MAWTAAWTMTCFTSLTNVYAQDESQSPSTKYSDIAPADDKDKKTRNFYVVLEDLLADFEFDLKNNNVQGLQSLSIRNIGMSENIPSSFKQHLELLISERILGSTKHKLTQCVPCRSRTARLEGNSIKITSPEQSPEELARLAERYAIKHFMDISFSYQTHSMILSLHITKANDQTLIWTRSYNSETSRASAFRRGIDYTQIEQARNTKKFEPTVQYRPTVYYFMERDVSGTNGVLGFGLRIMERYENRTKEVGFELNYLTNTTSLIGGSDTDTIYSGFNLTALFMHSWNLFGEVENYNRIRGNIFGGIGGTYASGYLGGLVRAGYEWRLGKFWSISINLGYRPPSTRFVDGAGTSISGPEFGVGIGAFF